MLETVMKTLNICSRTLFLIFLGMLLSEIEAIGKLLTKLANLPEICGVALVTAIFSPTASNAMLQDLTFTSIASRLKLPPIVIPAIATFVASPIVGC